MSFDRRSFALEGAYARDHWERAALLKHAEKLGLVSSSLQPVSASEPTTAFFSDVPTTRVSSRPAAEQPYQHVKGVHPVFPALSLRPGQQLGTKVSFSRARWDVDGASIFSVKQGKELAQQPVKHLSHYETQRSKRVRAAQWETPTVKGLRLLPVFTPGRALLWGTIFAVWGSSACVLSGMKALGIEKGDNVGEKLREILAPYGAAISDTFTPLKIQYEASGLRETERPNTLAKLATALKSNLSNS